MKKITIGKNEKGEIISRKLQDFDERITICVLYGKDGKRDCTNVSKYDEKGNKRYYTSGDKYHVIYVYDENGNHIQTRTIEGFVHLEKEYDENNNLISYKSYRGKQWTKYEFDDKGRIISGYNKKTHDEGPLVVKYYDDFKIRECYFKCEKGPSSMSLVKLDDKGQCIYSSIGNGMYVTKTEYDDEGRKIKVIYGTQKSENDEDIIIDDTKIYKYNDKGDLIYSENVNGSKRFYEITYEE